MAIKNQAITITYLAWDTVNDVGKTGDAANHTIKLIQDGTEAAASGTPTEINASTAPGWYKLALTAGEMNYNNVAVVGKSSTASIIVFGPSNIVTDRGSFAAIPAAVWANATRTLSSFGTLVADIWANATRTLSSYGTLVADIWANATRTITSFSGAGAEVWTYATRTLSSFGTLVVDIWSYATRALTTFSGAGAEVWTYATRTLSSFGTLVADIWAAGTRTLTSFGSLTTDTATAVWANATRTLSSFGTLVADIWAAGARTLTSFGSLTTDTATAVWANATRTLSSFGTLTTDTAAAVWAYATRTLTSFGTLTTDAATAVWAYATRSLTTFGTLVADIWSYVSRTVHGNLNEIFIDATSGNDSNPGTAASPKQTFSSAVTACPYGGTIVFARGTIIVTDDYHLVGKNIRGAGGIMSGNSAKYLKISYCTVRDIIYSGAGYFRMGNYAALRGSQIYGNGFSIDASNQVEITDNWISTGISCMGAGQDQVIIKRNILGGDVTINGANQSNLFINDNVIMTHAAMRLATSALGSFIRNDVAGNIDLTTTLTNFHRNLVNGTFSNIPANSRNNEQYAKAGTTRDNLDSGFTTAQKDSIATTVWAFATRTLTSFGTLVADIWSYATRTLTALISDGSVVWTDATGSDSTGDGSFNNPWKTLKKAGDTSASGCTICLKGGAIPVAEPMASYTLSNRRVISNGGYIQLGDGVTNYILTFDNVRAYSIRIYLVKAQGDTLLLKGSSYLDMVKLDGLGKLKFGDGSQVRASAVRDCSMVVSSVTQDAASQLVDLTFINNDIDGLGSGTGIVLDNAGNSEISFCHNKVEMSVTINNGMLIADNRIKGNLTMMGGMVRVFMNNTVSGTVTGAPAEDINNKAWAEQVTALAIKAKTDNLPADPASQAAVDSGISGIQSHLGLQDVEIGLILAKTNLIPANPSTAEAVAAVGTVVQLLQEVTVNDMEWDFLASPLYAILYIKDAETHLRKWQFKCYKQDGTSKPATSAEVAVRKDFQPVGD